MFEVLFHVPTGLCHLKSAMPFRASFSSAPQQRLEFSLRPMRNLSLLPVRHKRSIDCPASREARSDFPVLACGNIRRVATGPTEVENMANNGILRSRVRRRNANFLVATKQRVLSCFPTHEQRAPRDQPKITIIRLRLVCEQPFAKIRCQKSVYTQETTPFAATTPAAEIGLAAGKMVTLKNAKDCVATSNRGCQRAGSWDPGSSVVLCHTRVYWLLDCAR